MNIVKDNRIVIENDIFFLVWIGWKKIVKLRKFSSIIGSMIFIIVNVGCLWMMMGNVMVVNCWLGSFIMYGFIVL